MKRASQSSKSSPVGRPSFVILLVYQVPVLLHYPHQKLLPRPFPILVDVGVFLGGHAGVLQAPLDQLTPSEERHIFPAYHDLVEVVRERRPT